MEEYDISGNIPMGTETAEETSAKVKKDSPATENDMTVKDVFAVFCSHPKLTTLLYENLPYLEIEALQDALVFAATGNETELLQLLSTRKRQPTVQ